MRVRRCSLLRRFGHCVVIGALALAAASAVLWATSGLAGSVGLFSLGSDTSVCFVHGTAEFRHVYEHGFAAPVPSAQWHTVALGRGWVTPAGGTPAVPRFGFSAGHVLGITGTPNSGRGGVVYPARYWLLHVPLWATMLPGALAAAWLVVRWERRMRERAARRRGFEVLAGPSAVAVSQA